jgi:hypothetical protein
MRRTRRIARAIGCRLLVIGGGSLVIGTAPAGAQERLAARRGASVQPVYQRWTFGDGFTQPTIIGDSIRIDQVTQIAVPLGFAIELGDRWRLGASGAFARSTIALSDGAAVGETELELSGITDLKLTLTGQIVPDRLLFTVGANVPTGKQELDPVELEALRVVAAPALGLPVSALGTGAGATAGIVAARQLGAWGWALGLSYELRNTYAPYAASATLPPADFNPSDAIHVSIGGDGTVGESGMTVSLAADIYTQDKVTLAGGEPLAARAGPTIAADWQYALAVPGFRRLALFITDRYRASARSGDSTLTGSSGNYLDAGIASERVLGANTGLVVGLAVRHQTGLDLDTSVASAKTMLGAVTVGITRRAGDYTLQPFVRAQLGTLEAGPHSTNASSIGIGLSIASTF